MPPKKKTPVQPELKKKFKLHKPTRLKVGACVYTIHWDQDSWDKSYKKEERVGTTNHDTSDIYIRPELSLSAQREVLMHEVLHVMLWVGGISLPRISGDHDEQEEAFVQAFTPWLHLLYTQNPQIADFMTSVGEV